MGEGLGHIPDHSIVRDCFKKHNSLIQMCKIQNTTNKSLAQGLYHTMVVKEYGSFPFKYVLAWLLRSRNTYAPVVALPSSKELLK